MITFVNINYRTQKLRRRKQRIGIFDMRERGKKYFDLPKNQRISYRLPERHLAERAV